MIEDDLNMLDHFWNNKGDLERWCDWEKRKPHIDPLIVKAWEDYKLARELLSRLIDSADVQVTYIMNAFPIQDAEGLRLAWQPRQQPGHAETKNYATQPGHLWHKGFIECFSSYQTGSEVRALCIECGCIEHAPSDFAWPGCDYCTKDQKCDCQDGQALYRITGEVELKQWCDLKLQREKVGIDCEMDTWLCVAPAEMATEPEALP